MEQEYYNQIEEELLKLSVKTLTSERMDVICAGNGQIYNVTKNAVLQNIKKHGVYLSKSYVHSLKTVSEEQRKKIGDALRGRTLSQETKDKIGAASIRNNTVQHLIDNAYYNQGQPHPLLGTERSAEANRKSSEAMQGRTYTEEHKLHISEGKQKMFLEQGESPDGTRNKIRKARIEDMKTNNFNLCDKIKKCYHEIENMPRAESIQLKSWYEKRACEIMDEDDTIAGYMYNAFEIEFKDETGKTKVHLVDFMVRKSDDSIVFVEVKPLNLIRQLKDERFEHEIVLSYCTENGVPYEHWDSEKLGIDPGYAYMIFGDIYETYEQASRATQALDVQNSIEYQKRYKEDPRLASNPNLVYPCWDGWERFLGKKGELI